MQTKADIETNKLFPVFLKLEQLPVLLVGGGKVALEKLLALLNNSPAVRVKIVAPYVLEEIKQMVGALPGCKIEQRKFEDGDLDEARLVICATDNRGLHEHIKKLAAEKTLLVNVADTPDLCDFYLGSIVQRGNLKIAISTNGKSPTIAKRVKEVIGELIPAAIDDLIQNMQLIRNGIDGSFEEKVKRLNELTKELVSKNDQL